MNERGTLNDQKMENWNHKKIVIFKFDTQNSNLQIKNRLKLTRFFFNHT